MSAELRIQIEALAKDETGAPVATVKPIITEAQGLKICVLHIDLQRPIDPKDVTTIIECCKKLQRYLEGDVLALSGRGPIWMYAALLHAVGHLFRAVGTVDPKLKGVVITASHHPKIREFEVIQLPPEVLEQITQVQTPGGK